MSRDCIEEVAKNFEGYKLSYGKKKKKRLLTSERLKACLILNNLRAIIISIFLSILYTQYLIYSSIYSTNIF